MRRRLSATIRRPTRIAADNSTGDQPTAWRNWAGNQTATPRRLERPESIDDLADTVRAARADGPRVKPIGSGHSFTSIGVTDGVQLDLSALDGPISIDQSRGLVTVEGGIPIHRLNDLLHRYQLAPEPSLRLAATVSDLAQLLKGATPVTERGVTLDSLSVAAAELDADGVHGADELVEVIEQAQQAE